MDEHAMAHHQSHADHPNGKQTAPPSSARDIRLGEANDNTQTCRRHPAHADGCFFRAKERQMRQKSGEDPGIVPLTLVVEITAGVPGAS